jgi:F0F1-type ATP synthase membrane subunit c/vacuolar-type H+-ATPase subunit K
MREVFWRQRWREECECTRFFIGIAVMEGLIITGLAAALVWALR